MKIEKVKKLLTQNVLLIQKSLISFEKSLLKCRQIELDKELSFEEQEALDSLTSKFARISDIFTQKIIRAVSIIYREEPKTFIDLANFAEKIGLISNAEILLNIRDLRNEIAHEYVDDEILLLYQKSIELAEDLTKQINITTKYIKGNNLLKMDF